MNKALRERKKEQLMKIAEKHIARAFSDIAESYYLNFKACSEYYQIISKAMLNLSKKFLIEAKSYEIDSLNSSYEEEHNESCDMHRDFIIMLYDEEDFDFAEYFKEKLKIFC